MPNREILRSLQSANLPIYKSTNVIQYPLLAPPPPERPPPKLPELDEPPDDDELDVMRGSTLVYSR